MTNFPQQFQNQTTGAFTRQAARFFVAVLFVIILPIKLLAQAPTISYSSPQLYLQGVAITPLSPTTSGVDAQGYSGSEVTFASGFSQAIGLATDAAGNIYVSDATTNIVNIFPSGGGAPVAIASGFNAPVSLAVDAAGNVYVADQINNAIKKIPVGGGVPVVISTAFNHPPTVAVDAAGNVYSTDQNGHFVYKIPAAGGSRVAIGGNIFNSPNGLAVDASGNIYVADLGNHAVYEIPATGGAAVLVNAHFTKPASIAVDASGNLFIGDTGGSGSVAMLPAGSTSSTSPTIIGAGGSGIAIDNAGNVYTSNLSSVLEIKPVGGYYVGPFLPAGLTFNNSTGVIAGTPTAASPATNYTVTAYNSNGSSTATVNITVASNNANLSGLAISRGTLTPVFSAGTTSYTATVPNATTVIAVEPNSADAGATITVNGTAVASGATSPSLPLAIGSNTITTVVTAADGVTTKTYTLTVTRTPLTNANLANLTTSAGALTPVFVSGTTSYTALVSISVTSVTVTPTTADGTATVTVNGTAVASGSASASIPVSVGLNTITTVVTGQDGITKKTYTLTVKCGSTNANLSNLAISNGALTPAFSALKQSYTAIVNGSTASITVTPTISDATATVKVNGTTVASGTASPALPMAFGSNVIYIVVTAQNGTVKTYILTVTKKESSDATLSNLVISHGTLSPAFATGTTSYTASVAYTTTSLQITPTTNDTTATVKVNGVSVVPGTATAILPLSTGHNVFTTIVTAEDGTTDTYTINVTRTSPDANLANLALSSGTLSPAFAAATNVYTASVSAINSIKITPTTNDAAATVKINGTAVTSGTASAALPLIKGQNFFKIIVTAFDGTTKTYSLTVTRTVSNNPTLANLTVSTGALSPVFASGTSNYTTPVSYGTTTVRVTPTATVATASITVNNIPIASGATTSSILLNTGVNNITVAVTAEDGITVKIYTIAVARTSPDANLSNLTVSSGTMSPAFATGTTGYTDSVSNTTTSVTITPVTHDPAATVTVAGSSIVSGTASDPIPLSIGSNSIFTVVTAFDGTRKTYALTVVRASAGGNNIVNNSLSLSAIGNPSDTLQNDGIVVHQGLSPNGDGINDFLIIDGIANYPANHLAILNSNGAVIFEVKNYDNVSKVFDGHAQNGTLQIPGTYYYALDYTNGGVAKHKTGFIILKY